MKILQCYLFRTGQRWRSVICSMIRNAVSVAPTLKFRFLCCQEQLLFLCDALNIIDLLDLLIFVAYAITRSLAIQQYGPERHFLISIMHKTRLLCVARLFKLCRHSRGLRLVFQNLEKLLVVGNLGQSVVHRPLN